MPASVLTMVLGLTAFQPPRVARAVAIALVVVGLAVTPARVQFAATLHRMPEYGILLDGSRWLVEKGHPISGIRTDFQLPPTADPEFLYRILGRTHRSLVASGGDHHARRTSDVSSEIGGDSGCLPLTDELNEGCDFLSDVRSSRTRADAEWVIDDAAASRPNRPAVARGLEDPGPTSSLGGRTRPHREPLQSHASGRTTELWQPGLQTRLATHTRFRSISSRGCGSR